MISLDQVTSIVRKLAKTSENQSLYTLSKELHYPLFLNNRDFTSVQLMYLNYLNFYYSIYLDMYMQEIDEKVLENEIYEDAYAVYKAKLQKKKMQPLPDYKPQNKPETQEAIISKWHFQKRRTK